MKLDWSQNGWRVFSDEDALPTDRPDRFIAAERLQLSGVELVRDPRANNHGWVVVPGQNLEKLLAMMGDEDATELSADGS